MHADGPRRMHALEHLVPNPLAGRQRHAQVRIGTRADEHRPRRQASQNRQAPLEPALPTGHDAGQIRRQRVRVDGGDEDRMRPRRRIGHPAVRPGAQRRPLPRLQKQGPHLVFRHPARMASRPRAEIGGFRRPPLALGPALLDHHRLQRTPGAAVDGPDRPGGRGGIADRRHRLVLEQQLAAGDRVAHYDVHGRPETDVVGRHERHMTDRTGFVDRIGRLSGNGQSQAAGDPVVGHVGGPSRIPRTRRGSRHRLR